VKGLKKNLPAAQSLRRPLRGAPHWNMMNQKMLLETLSVNSAWFVTRRGRRPITQYSWRIAHIEPTYILTYGVLMGFPVSIEGACQECSLACLPPDARRHMSRTILSY